MVSHVYCAELVCDSKHKGPFIAVSAATVALARKLDVLMRPCNAFFLFSVPRTSEGRVGRAPLVYVEVTVGVRRASSRVPDHCAIRRLNALGIGIQRDRGKHKKQRTNDRAHT
jgi:hypothetical protein